MALGNAQPRRIGIRHLAMAVCAAALLTVLVYSGFGNPSITADSGSEVETAAMVGSDLVPTTDTGHRDGNCSHEHESSDCSPCPTCSAALLSSAEGDSNIAIAIRAPVLQSHYDDVAPTGIRRPPRLS